MNPITALEFHRTRAGVLLLLAGEGSCLKVFQAEGAKLLHRCEVFHGQIIHGIVVRDDLCHGLDLQIVIWGGPNLALLSTQDFEQLLDQNVSSVADSAISVSDWVLDVAISPFDPISCVLVTTHNTVIRARLGQPLHAPVIETLHSPSRSILYSAHLTWESPSCVMVAAGTVFGEIIVWQCSPSDEISERSHVLFTFTGHEGSIFGVNISPPIIGLHSVTRLLASCSDDRTIRIWNLTADSRDSLLSATAVLARETGFGENGASTEQKDPKHPPLAMVMGHASRIWRVRFLGERGVPLDPSSLSIISFGEDSTAQQWALRIEKTSEASTVCSDVIARLDPLRRFAFHSGKHIWSTALCRWDDLKILLATGGADGKICMYETGTTYHAMSIERPSPSIAIPQHISGQAQLNGFTHRSWELGEILQSLVRATPVNPALEQHTMDTSNIILWESISTELTKSEPTKKAFKDSFNRYAFVSGNELLATTTSGRVLLCHVGSEIQWSEVGLPESGRGDLRSYAVLVGLPEIGVACLAGANGSLYAYRRHQDIFEVGRVGGKVADILNVFHSREGFQLLVTTLGGASPTLFSFDLSGEEVLVVSKTVYGLPLKFIVTSAASIKNILIMGSRSGSLALYDSESPEAPPQIWEHSPGPTRDAITSIVSLPSSDDSENGDTAYFITTSRDGFYSIFSTTRSREVSVAKAHVVVRLVHHSAPPIGPLIETGWFEGQTLFLYGFKGKNFVVWNETAQCEVISVECGGSHRSFAYSPVRDSGLGYFVYTKASKMYLHSHQQLSHEIVKAGGHGREIKACAVSEDHRLIATGAEDTAIRIWKYDKLSTSLETPMLCPAVIQKHSAGIQHLQWHESHYLFSSGGNEEFFVWAVERIPGFGIGVCCEASCPDPSQDRDLRIMNFHVTALPVPSVLSTQPCLLISLAYSDSTIRTYLYEKQTSFLLLCTGRYTSSCLTQIRHVRVDKDGFYLLTTATDGRLALWGGVFVHNLRKCTPLSSQLTLLKTQMLHQNSIKSLDIAESNGQILVATGGDDNALGISLYPKYGPLVTSSPACFILRLAHAAAVTGLCFLQTPDTAPGRLSLRLATSSNDQKLAIWHFELDTDSKGGFWPNFRKVKEAFTPVADVGDLAVLDTSKNGSKILVVGNGMEIWEVLS